MEADSDKRAALAAAAEAALAAPKPISANSPLLGWGTGVGSPTAEELTWVQRLANFIAGFSGSMPFLFINAAIFFVWIATNMVLDSGAIPGAKAFDPFPFGLLTMAVSLEAIFLSIFVLLAQNLQAAKDRIRSDVEVEDDEIEWPGGKRRFVEIGLRACELGWVVIGRAQSVVGVIQPVGRRESVPRQSQAMREPTVLQNDQKVIAPAAEHGSRRRSIFDALQCAHESRTARGKRGQVRRRRKESEGAEGEAAKPGGGKGGLEFARRVISSPHGLAAERHGHDFFGKPDSRRGGDDRRRGVTGR
ncbi:MAG: DUF1003 domain-containing protein [Chloroflexi bacterium]|nr:DUF1003 domain-containing protein [Chloroflexota bacterium]